MVVQNFMIQIPELIAHSDCRGHKHVLVPSPANFVFVLQAALATSEPLTAENQILIRASP